MHHLKPDGKVGTQTIFHLDTATGAKGSPHLKQDWPKAEQRAEILNQLRSRGIDPDHLARVVHQEVLAVVAKRIADFDRQRTGSFRAWLKSITINCVRQMLRRNQRREGGTGGSDVLEVLQQLEDVHGPMSLQWDREHDEFVMKQLLQDVRHHFTESTWRAFERVALDEASADDVAAELGITPNAVFIARSRVMARLRQEAAGLID